MGHERPLDLAFPSDARAGRERRPRRHEGEEAGATSERRFAELVRRAGRDEEALIGLLRGLQPDQQLMGRLVLVRAFGGARASALCEAALGPGQATIPITRSPPPRPAPPREGDRLALHLARGARDLVVRLLDPALASGGTLRELLGGLDDNVAQAALSLLRRTPDVGRGGDAFSSIDHLTGGMATALAGRGGRAAPPQGPGPRALAYVAGVRAARLYRRAIAEGADPGHPDVRAALARLGFGRPLPEEVRREMERRLGAPLGDVRIHTDEMAALAAEALGARAFTFGDDVFFARHAFDPRTSDGRGLLAHELTHVLQGRRGGGVEAAAPTLVSRPDEAHEREAEAVAATVAAEAKDEPAREKDAKPGEMHERLVGLFRGRRELFTHAMAALEQSLGRYGTDLLRQSVVRSAVRGVAPHLDPAALVSIARRGEKRGVPFQAAMEKRLGVPLGNVEVFTGEAGRLACEVLDAMAFAVENVVVFGEDSPGEEVVAHELSHVIQQGGHRTRAPARYAPGSLSVGAHGSAPEREAHAVAAGAPASTLGTSAPAIHRATGGGGGGNPRAPIEAALDAKGIHKADRPKLVRYIVDELLATSRDATFVAAAGTTVAQLIEIGRTRWSRQFQPLTFLRQLAQELHDAEAERKVSQLQSERDIDPNASGGARALKDRFAGEVITRVISESASAGYGVTKITDARIYDDNTRSAFTEVAGTGAYAGTPVYVRKGRLIDLSRVSGMFDRASGLSRFFQINLQAAFQADQLAHLRAHTDPSGHGFLPTAVGSPGTGPAAGIDAYMWWRYRVATDTAFAATTRSHVDTGSRLQGSNNVTWWSTDHVRINRADQLGLQQAFGSIVDLGGLDPGWYDQGMVRLRIRPTAFNDRSDPANELRKPTVFDGMFSHLWRPATNANGWGITASLGSGSAPGSGIPEAIAGTISADKLINGPLGVVPIVNDFARTVFDPLQPFMSVYGDAATKRFFGTPRSAVVLQFNPEFTLDLGGQQTDHYRLVQPAIQHPGVLVHEVNIRVAAPGSTQVTGGWVLMDLDVGGGLAQRNVRKEIRPDAGGGGTAPPQAAPAAAAGAAATGHAQVDNNFDQLTSRLDRFLGGRITTRAGVNDQGVFATVQVNDGPSGIPHFNLQGSQLTATYNGSQLLVDGRVGIAHDSGKVSGSVGVEYDGTAWIFTGEATVSDLVEGLSPFTVSVRYREGDVQIRADSVSYTRTFGAITLTGTASDVLYDVEQGHFSADVDLTADLGMFGRASAGGRIERNRLQRASFSYDSPELRYPREGDPVFQGTVGGTLAYSDGRFSGDIRGSAELHVAALQRLAGPGGALGLAVDVHVNENGGYSGTIRSTQPIQLGEHFQIPSLSASLNEDGSVSSEFTIAVVRIAHLENASITCAIDRNGFHVRSANIRVPFGTPNQDRMWGALGVSYEEGHGFRVGGDLHVRIRDGMVAHGTLTYDTQTNVVNADLSVDEITLLRYGPQEHRLFSFNRQIPLVSLYGILGLYLDAGFDLNFNYSFDLRMRPAVHLRNLSLETLHYDSIGADVQLLGALVARLVATPHVGLGLYALSPSLLRGGGGIRVPIVGEARLTPSGTFGVTYSPDGGVQGAARIGMALTFGIQGSVRPYAEFSVLDGAYNPTWEGDALANFTILPPRELFNYTLDLGGNLQTNEHPTLPGGPQAPSETQADRRIGQERGSAQDTPVQTGTRDQAPGSAPATGDAGGGGSGGFDLGGMIGQLLRQPRFSSIREVMDAAAGAWDQIRGFVGGIVSFFRNWFSSIGHGVADIIRGFQQHGLAGYLKLLLREKVGGELYDIIEPLLNAIGSFETQVIDLVSRPMPDTPERFFQWALDTLRTMLGIGWGGVRELASAVGTMISRAGAAAGRFINYLVQQGKIGVARHCYYYWLFGNHYFLAADQYKIRFGGVDTSFRETGMLINPNDAVAIVLWNALRAIPQVVPTNTQVDRDCGEAYNDYWVGN